MNLTRERLTFVALIVSESAWVFAFISVLGYAAGSWGSPINYFAILGLLGLSTLTYSYIRWKQFEAFELFYFGATLGGLILCYLIVAASYRADAFTIGWITELFTEQWRAEGQTFRAGAGGLMAVGLWFRGIRLSIVSFPEKSLTFSFRLGLFLIGFAAVMDMIIDEPLNVFLMVLIFFGSGLAGLNIGHLVPETAASTQTKTWPKAIGLAVIAVLIVGGMFGFLHQGFLRFVTSPARYLFDRVWEGLLLIIGVPVVLAIEGVGAALGAFFGKEFVIEGGEAVTATPTPEPEELDFSPISGYGSIDERASDIALLVAQIARYAIVVAAIVVASVLLYALMRKIGKRLKRESDEERESLFEEMRFASDIGDLFSDFFGNVRDLLRRGARKVFRLPPGPPGVVEALRLYYQMITTAEQNSVTRPGHATPDEFRNDLKQVFNSDLVEPATSAFNRAQYGDIPSAEEDIARMRSIFRVEVAPESGAPQPSANRPRTREARFETMSSEVLDDPLKRAKFDSASLRERNWFTGISGVALACGGFILFALVMALGLVIVLSLT